MTGIVDLYRKHKDLLSIYFHSEEEAADCEKRAEMGDDRAQRVMSLVYGYREKKPQKIYFDPGSIPGAAFARSRLSSVKDLSIYETINTQQRNNYHREAQIGGNSEALDFADSTQLGNRTIDYLRPTQVPIIELGKVTFLTDLDETKNHDPIDESPEYHSVYYHVPTNDFTRYELLTATNGSTFNILYRNGACEWPADKRSTRISGSSHAAMREIEDHWVLNKRYISPLETCVLAGDAKAAKLLAKICAQKTFYEKLVKAHFFSQNEYQQNPLYNTAKAKEWQRIADHLEGKSATPLEQEKFLNTFLFSQDKTPEGLYNIGYALYHNDKIGDPARGLDFLKHAANLGDANAARELGEIYHDRFDAKGDHADLRLAHFWYQVAATTPMTVTDSYGKPAAYEGHPNGRARVAYLEKAYPELASVTLDEKAIRNPSAAHIGRYPASAWYVEVPRVDVAGIIHDPRNGSLTERMAQAVHAIDGSVREFETMTQIIQARIDELAARQLVLDGKVDAMKGEEITALRNNDSISAQQRTSQRAIDMSKDRWAKETAANLGATLVLGLFFAPAMAGPGGSATGQIARLMVGGASRATGYKAVSKNETDYHKALIEELEARKIDTSKFPEQIDALAKLVQEIADSGPAQKLLKNEKQAQALVEGYLRQRILKSGLENCRSLEDYAKMNGVDSLDTLLASFEKGDARLYTALAHLCHGHANSNDMTVLLADTNAMKGDLPPHEKALKRYVERVMKESIAYYMTRASQIDVIEDLGLVNFRTMDVDSSIATADLMQGMHTPNAEEQGKQQVDAATKLALTSMFSSQFGVSHIGQYDVTRMFNFYLHRHGNHELIAAELYDGAVSDTLASKRVNVRSPKDMRGFVERAKESAARKREDLPEVGDLFLRVCGYEYYLPQAVITSGRGNRFKENPEAPVAYPMVNEVIQQFIEKMSLGPLETYRNQVGEELDNVIAQTFIDFFQQVGRTHATQFTEERGHLRDAHTYDNYSPRFTAYRDKITADALAQFPTFLEIYERNLKKQLLILPEDEAALLQQQIADLHQHSRQYLAPEVDAPGSFQAKEHARKQDHRGTNMTEPWVFH